MAERFLKVKASRRQVTEIYLKVDDKDPRFMTFFNSENEKAKTEIYRQLRGEIVVQAAKETTFNYDWEMCPFPIEVDQVSEVEELDARQFPIYDVEPK